MDHAAAMALLHIRLLGGCHLTYAGQPITTVNQARVQSLLAWLLLHRQASQARGHLAFTFWPDFSEAQARNNLRQMLHQLRHALPGGVEFLHTDANSVQWLPDGPYRLDVADFEALAGHAAQAAGADDQEGALRSLQAALDLYRGDLLPSCYDDWIAPERARLHQLAAGVCRQLIDLLEAQRDYAAALDAGRRLLQLDPLDETTYVTLMRLHALNNDRAGALRVYHDCVTLLQRELEVEPGAEVEAAYRRLLRPGAPAAPTTVAQSTASGAIPLVGRQAEWEQLRRVWQQSARGQPSFVLITGEAGIGKTRLAEELFEWAARQGIAAARTRAYEAEGRLSYAPISEWLRSPALAPALARLDKVWLEEIARLLPELLARQPDLQPPAPLAEHWQRQRFYEALARGILGGNAPLLLLIDDLQWCDQETLEWLHFLLRFDSQARLLVVATVRSEAIEANAALQPLLRALQAADQLHTLALAPLNADQVASLANKTSKRTFTPAAITRLMAESEGVPLFVVELVRSGPALDTLSLTPGGGPVAPGEALAASAPLTPKLHAVIAGRLDQLSKPARELAGVAATIGRAFTLDVLVRAAGKDEETVVDALEELWQRRIVREQAANAYDFSHDKLRSVAYDEVSPVQRRHLHRRVAQALQELHAGDLDAVSGQLAAHFELAGLLDQAVAHYQQAAAAARRLLAYDEAIGRLNRGLALLAALPATPQRQRQTLALLMALGTLLAATKGNAAEQVRDVYVQAFDLCKLVGSQQQMFVVQQELRICYGQRGELAAAHPLAHANLALAQELHNPELLRYAHLGVAVIGHAQGELSLARAHFEQAIAQPAEQAGNYDPMFFDNALQGSLRHSALTLWLLGYAAQARARMQGALAVGRHSAQSVRYGMTLLFAAMLHQHLGEVQSVQLRAEQIKALATNYGYAYLVLSGSMLEAWALAQLGRAADGAARLHTSLEARRASGHRLFFPYELSLLCEAHLLAGETAAGLAAVEEALAVVTETGERVWQAEILRLRAELLLAQGAPEIAVESSYRQALAVAEQQEAKALQLRAATGLARLWQRSGRAAEARQLLAPLYGWFSEGFDTPDLLAAHALLAVR